MNEAATRPARDRWLRRFHQVLVGTLWTATFGVVCAWIFNIRMPGGAEPEPLAALLGMISTSVTWLYGVAARRFEQNRQLLAETRAELEEERFSLSHALAYGYVHNFLEPAATHLLEQAGNRAREVKFYVYVPSDLTELEPDAIKRTLVRMREWGYETRTLQLNFHQARSRDVITLLGGSSNELRYLDFPTTLLTLRQLIEYRLETRPDRFPAEARRDLGQSYIAMFRKELERYLHTKELTRTVVLVDRDLAPLATPAPSSPSPDLST
jgi:hypothetical protein